MGNSEWGRNLELAIRVNAIPFSTALMPDEVHLWVVDLSPEATGPEPYADAARRQAATTAAERDRAARFRRPGDGERHLSAHGALRLILAGYLACDPLALRFSTEAWGKPMLDGVALQFNLSHSGALALIAVAHDRRVGVDVECLRPIADLAAIAERICSPGERSALDAVAESDRDRAFLAMWTRKEALAKMTGEGIRALSRDVELDQQNGCGLVQVHDLPGYAACVAAEGTTWRLARRP
jgi:4'-phosphopantetheinyl transferase